MSSELKVGLLFFLGLILVAAFIFSFSTAFHSHGKYLVRFARIARLQVGDEVTYNGVKVGSITGIRPVVVPGANGPAPAVDVEFSVESSAQPNVLVSPSTIYRINQGILGGSDLAIVSSGGSPIHPSMDNPPQGTTPSSLDEAVASVNTILTENRENIHGTIAGARTAMEHVGAMSEEIRGMVHEDRPHVTTALINVGQMSGGVRDLIARNSDNVTATIASLKSLSARLDGVVAENRAQIRTMLANFTRAGEQVAEAARQIAAAVGENRENLRRTMAGLGAFAPRLDRIGANLELITGQIASGRGTIGKLVMDDSLHDRALQAVDNINQRMEELKPVTGPIAALKLYGVAESGWDERSGVTDTYLMLRLEPRPWKFYEGGVSYRTAPKGRTTTPDNPNSLNVDFNIRLGWRFFRDDRDQCYRLTVAAGLIDSQVGGYVQAPLIPHWLDVEVMCREKDNQRQPSDRRYESGNALVRAYLQANLYRERVFLNVGGDDLSDRPGLWLGLTGQLLDNDLRNITSLAALAQ